MNRPEWCKEYHCFVVAFNPSIGCLGAQDKCIGLNEQGHTHRLCLVDSETGQEEHRKGLTPSDTIGIQKMFSTVED